MTKYLLLILIINTNIGFAQNNLNEFLILDLPFNGNAIDESGNINSLFEINGASLCNDRNEIQNSAYLFDGIDDYISIPHTNLLNFTNSYSLSFWVRLSSDIVGEQERIIGKGLAHSGDVQNWSFTFKDDQKLDFFWEPLDDANMLNTTDQTLDSQKFYHIVGLVDVEEQETRLYINGNINIINSTYGSTPTTNNDDLLIGVRENLQLGGGFDNYFDGIIDDIKIFSKALNSCEVLALYNEGTNNYPSIDSVYITQNDNTLSASHYASSYIWYLNDEILEGVNTQDIEISIPGNYQVQLQSDNCLSEFTEGFNLELMDKKQPSISIYPNPSNTYITINSNGQYEIKLLSLINIEGRLLQTEYSDLMYFNDNIESGFYILKISLKDGSTFNKTIVITDK